ncbi:Zinc finger CCCH domain-containing protein [Stagonosporopsis vannaccii]|nr:Zinc finger CCCH domain-containing protein [Stagonosporopsis vannaccii]
MAPPGPPPYTIDQINAMNTKEERIRARAELNSTCKRIFSCYIARMKKEQQDRLADSPNGHPSRASFYNATSGFAPRARGAFRGSFRGGPQRGGYSYGEERGAASYHPYQRRPPAHGSTRFKHRTVVFNKPEGFGDPAASESTSASASAPLSTSHSRQNSQPPTEVNQLCATFTSTGLCTRHGCPLVHDPDKQALCKRWLFKNDCNKGDHCSLSHTPTPHNVPTCLHFQEGRCTNEDCRFAHVRVNPAAQICDAFGRLGYCEKGAECADLHAYECPDFANKGECIRGDKCQHRHVHRASRMRKAAGRSSPEDRSQATSPEAEDPRSETPSWSMGLSMDSSRAPQIFTQQVDYVPLDAED